MINRGAVEAWWWHQSSIPRSQIHVGRVLFLLATKTAETVVFHASTSIFWQAIWVMQSKPMHIAFIMKHIVSTNTKTNEQLTTGKGGQTRKRETTEDTIKCHTPQIEQTNNSSLCIQSHS